MITISKEVSIYCDIQKDENCLFEDSVVLSLKERISKAKKLFKKWGWVFKNEKHICPYCNTGNKKLGKFKLLYENEKNTQINSNL